MQSISGQFVTHSSVFGESLVARDSISISKRSCESLVARDSVSISKRSCESLVAHDFVS